MKRMKDKVVVVTGGSRGIGKCIINKFIEEGSRIVISISTSNIEDSYKLKNIQLDVRNGKDIHRVINNIKQEFGRIDVLVNNAGIIDDGLIQNIDDDSWNNVIDINLKGVFNLTKEIAPIMIEQGKGSIVNISSIVGLYGNIGQTNYAASKSGLIGMSYSWAKEFTRKGTNVRTNVVAPGYIQTDMLNDVPKKVLDSIKSRTPLKRLGKPEEVANAVLFLASDESSFINGHVLEVTGGLRL